MTRTMAKIAPPQDPGTRTLPGARTPKPMETKVSAVKNQPKVPRNQELGARTRDKVGGRGDTRTPAPAPG